VDPYLGFAAADMAAQPGDLILVHAGTYSGTAQLTASGDASGCIVWRAAPGESPMLDGMNAANPLLRLQNIHHVIVEGLSLRRTSHAVVVNTSHDIALRKLTITESTYGITTNQGGNVHQWISDCVITGPYGWPGTGSENEARGIEVAGEGIVVCHNRISNFRDAIDTQNYHPCRDIDFYLNELSELVDDGIELDFSDCNTRAYQNRLTNCFQGISFQPAKGGPC
jgi:nitrous oxidase accessory protein NosD